MLQHFLRHNTKSFASQRGFLTRLSQYYVVEVTPISRHYTSGFEKFGKKKQEIDESKSEKKSEAKSEESPEKKSSEPSNSTKKPEIPRNQKENQRDSNLSQELSVKTTIGMIKMTTKTKM